MSEGGTSEVPAVAVEDEVRTRSFSRQVRQVVLDVDRRRLRFDVLTAQQAVHAVRAKAQETHARLELQALEWEH